VGLTLKIVITGGTGFLGSWAARVLAENHNVTVIVRPDSNAYRLAGIRGLRTIKSQPKDWARAINLLQVDALLMFDWEGVANEARNDSIQFSNVKRIQNFVKELDSIALVMATGSQAELGPVNSLIWENQIDSPTTAYGRAKVLTRKILEEELAKRETKFIWARVFSTYGPLDAPSWLIPDLLKTVSLGRKFETTAGEQIWSYLHAFDFANAVGKVIQTNSLSGIVNFGNPQTIRLRDVIREAATIAGNAELIAWDSKEYREDQVMRLEPSCERLQSIGWSPQVNMSAGLIHLFEWLILKRNTELRLIDGTSVSFDLPPAA